MADRFRSMKPLTYKGQSIYSSTFDTQTGAIVRKVWEPAASRSYPRMPWDNDEAFEKVYGWRKRAFSPVPETVDISITDKCGFGCTYCYQDSKPARRHGAKDLVEKIITGFDEAPYQIAIGGGEPTEHPDFAYILRRARELGTVPNYTTNGANLIDEIVEATNEVCGGVAMTYHAFKGLDWFEEHYTALRSALKVQVNIHLIADKDAATNLRALMSLQAKVGKLNVVLLAYYPDVGRASLTGLVTKSVYQRQLPSAVKDAIASGMGLSFSEGLLPYFLSRPEIGVETRFAMPSEGHFSCYFDPLGNYSPSSFDPPHRDKDRNARKMRAQEFWNRASFGRNEPHGGACYGCEKKAQCSIPSEYHYLLCAFAEHNKTPPKDSDIVVDDSQSGNPLDVEII